MATPSGAIVQQFINQVRAATIAVPTSGYACTELRQLQYSWQLGVSAKETLVD